MKIILTESQILLLKENITEVKMSPEQVEKRNERIIKIGKKYKTQREFSLKNSKDFGTARKYGLLDTIFPDRKKYRRDVEWTPEKITDVAKNYGSKSEFQKADQFVYNKASTLGMLDTLFPEKKRKYSLEKSLELAKGFEDPWDFNKEYPGAHRVLKDNDLLKSSFPNYEFGKRGPKEPRQKYKGKSFDEWIEHAKQLVRTKMKSLNRIDYALYYWLRSNGADMKQFRLPDPDQSILFKRAEKYDSPRELRIGNGYLFNQIKSIPGALEKLFPNSYNSPIDPTKKKLPNPNVEIPNDPFFKIKKDDDKLDDDRKYGKRSFMFTPVTEEDLGEEKLVRYFEGDEYGIPEQIDWLMRQKEFIFLGQGAGHKLKLINNIIHNLQKLK